MMRPRVPLSRLAQLRPRCPAAAAAAPAQLVQARLAHNMPELSKDKSSFLDHGVGPPEDPFLSVGTVDLAWTQYMGLTLKKLNRLTEGREFDVNTNPNSLRDLVIKTARDPINAPVFNYASMAHNNHFFFDGLTSSPAPIPENLREALEASFGSLETLRREFLVTAIAMFGPGFVWLVKTHGNNFRLLPTYLAGTPYPKAHYRRQGVDMNTVDGQGPEATSVTGWMASQKAAVGGQPQPTRQPGSMGDLTPVLCLNTWEHVWIPDYGIVTERGRESKRAFVEKWWNYIDWDTVLSRAQLPMVRTDTLSY